MNLTMHVTLLTDAAISAWTGPAPGVNTASGQIEIAAAVDENSIAPGSLIFTAAATSDGSITGYTLVSSTDLVGALPAGTSGTVNVATGKNLDYETASKYIFVVR